MNDLNLFSNINLKYFNIISQSSKLEKICFRNSFQVPSIKTQPSSVTCWRKIITRLSLQSNLHNLFDSHVICIINYHSSRSHRWRSHVSFEINNGSHHLPTNQLISTIQLHSRRNTSVRRQPSSSMHVREDISFYINFCFPVLEEQPIQIRLTDVNDETPEFLNVPRPFLTTVHTNAPPGTSVYQLVAQDADEGSLVRYLLESGWIMLVDHFR